MEKYNDANSYPANLTNLKSQANLSDEEKQNLEIFRELYTYLAPSKRNNMLAHFYSVIWQDYKQTYYDEKLHARRRTLKLGVVALVLWLGIALGLPLILVQWRSLGTAQAQLDKSCSISSTPIGVNCSRVQSKCCYQREKNWLGQDTGLLAFQGPTITSFAFIVHSLFDNAIYTRYWVYCYLFLLHPDRFRLFFSGRRAISTIGSMEEQSRLDGSRSMEIPAVIGRATRNETKTASVYYIIPGLLIP